MRSITTKTFLSVICVFVLVACERDPALMYGNHPSGIINWDWSVIMGSMTIGIMLGLLYHKIKRRRRRRNYQS